MGGPARKSPFSDRIPPATRRILEDGEAMAYLYRVLLYGSEVARCLGVSAPTVGKARQLHGIPLFPRTFLLPDWHGDKLTAARWQTIKFRAYMRAGRPGLRAKEVAVGAFESVYPAERVARARLRAAEPDRFVVAVIIDPDYVYRGMPPQRYFAVARDLSRCEELPRREWSAYGFRGIK